MTTRRFLQLDVFSARPGSGNPLAVVLDADGLDDAAMQAIARWTKLPETTFVFPAPDAASSYRLRMFSPQKRCRSPATPVSAPHMQCSTPAWPRRATACWCRTASPGNCRCAWSRSPATAASPSARRARVTEQVQADDPRLSDSLRGWPLGALPPALMDGGRTWWVVELASEAALRSLDPDWNAIAALAESTGSMGVFAYARAAATGAYDLAVRAFVGNGRRFEDAASGAANAVLAAWLDSKDALPGTHGRYVVSQGRRIGFDALLELRIDANGEVWSGGQVQTVVRGTLDWE